MKYLSLCLVMAGCSSRPSIQVALEDGQVTSAQVEGLANATSPASILVQDGAVSISSGAGDGFDQSLAALSSTTSWAAIALIVAGLGSLIGSAWLPFLPRSTSIILMAGGAGLLAFPVLLDRYSLWIFMAAAGLLGLYMYGIWDNKRKLAKDPHEQAQSQ